jgi:hypothetical protein
VSTGLELVPIALAAGTVLAARRARIRPATAASARALSMPTRLRDSDLLRRALARAGEDCGEVDGVRAGTVGGLALALTRGHDGSFDAHFEPGTDQERAERALRTLDTAYCRELQADVYTRVLATAPGFGLSVTEESQESDGTLVVTLEASGAQG